MNKKNVTTKKTTISKSKPVEKNTTKSKASQARESKKVDIVSIIGEIESGKKPLERYQRDLSKDYASSFNWHLNEVINENWAYANGMFTSEECDRIIQLIKNGKSSSPLNYGVTGDNSTEISKFEDYSKVRVSPISWVRSDVEETRWIWQRIRDQVVSINNQFFNYDLSEIQSLQFTSYDSEEKGFYGKHIDMMYKSTGTRKLSLSVQLSNPEDYEGGSLLLHTGEEPLTLPKTRGTGLFFPSYSLHEVTPVTKGIRYSLVAWVLGPKFK